MIIIFQIFYQLMKAIPGATHTNYSIGERKPILENTHSQFVFQKSGMIYPIVLSQPNLYRYLKEDWIDTGQTNPSSMTIKQTTFIIANPPCMTIPTVNSSKKLDFNYRIKYELYLFTSRN